MVLCVGSRFSADTTRTARNEQWKIKPNSHYFLLLLQEKLQIILEHWK